MEKRLNPPLLRASRYFALAFSLASFSTFASTAKIIRLEDDERTATIRLAREGLYKQGDTVCAYQKSQVLTCGEVVESQGNEATVIFPEDDERPLVGDMIGTKEQAPNEAPVPQDEVADEASLSEELASEQAEPTVADENSDEISDSPREMASKKQSAPPPIESTEEEDRRKELVRYHRSKIKRRYASSDDALGRTFLRQSFGMSLGGAIYGESGTNNIWPNGLIQFALSRTTTVGIQMGYFTFGGNSVQGTSWYGTVNYHYYPYEAFVGPTGRFGVGLASTEYTATSGAANTTGTTTPVMLVGSLGWRWLTEGKINIGVEAGFQIQQLSVSTLFSGAAATSSITFFMPLIQIDFGFAL